MGFTRETHENDAIEIFKTHYYKTNYDNMKNAYIEFMKNNGFQVQEFNNDYGEGVAYNNKMSITAKIIMQNQRETSIDFFIECNGFFGKAKVINFLEEVYSYLAKKFEFKGLGLHQ